MVNVGAKSPILAAKLLLLGPQLRSAPIRDAKADGPLLNVIRWLPHYATADTTVLDIEPERTSIRRQRQINCSL